MKLFGNIVLLMNIFIYEVTGHSWMSCPFSFANFNGRGGHTSSLCENDGSRAHITEVQAGDRLKVGWPSNNHAGGWVRISLTKFGEHLKEETAKQNVLKFACYGYDMRNKEISRRGDCNHPCDSRGGCFYQAHELDRERFDTTVGIPTNLEDGLYVLQTAMLVGNGGAPYYSCGKLRISGGNPSFNCKSNGAPLSFDDCFKSRAGKEMKTHFLFQGAKDGDFCYLLDGTKGNADSNIRDVPVNVQCDPRITCGQSVQPQQCNQIKSMRSIRNSEQPGCKVYNVLPPVNPTCSDGKQNRDEEGVDCGGRSCPNSCPIAQDAQAQEEYYENVRQRGNIYASGQIVDLTVKLTRDIPADKCWQMIVQFDCPVVVNSVWRDAQLVSLRNHIVTLEKRDGQVSNRNKGSSLGAAFELENPCYTNTTLACNSCKEWTKESMQMNIFKFNMKDKGDCGNI